MSGVRTRRLWGPTTVSATTGSGTLLYTVPDGRTAIVRMVWAQNSNSSPKGMQLVLNGARARGLLTVPPDFGELVLDSWWVANPLDTIHALTTGSFGIQVTGFGVLLPGPPS